MDKDNNKISLLLQYNARDDDEKKGNAIKLTMTSLLESDQECHRKKESMNQTGGNASESHELVLEQTGWDLFVPR